MFLFKTVGANEYLLYFECIDIDNSITADLYLEGKYNKRVRIQASSSRWTRYQLRMLLGRYSSLLKTLPKLVDAGEMLVCNLDIHFFALLAFWIETIWDRVGPVTFSRTSLLRLHFYLLLHINLPHFQSWWCWVIK